MEDKFLLFLKQNIVKIVD